MSILQHNFQGTPAVLAAAVFGGLGLLWLYRKLRRRQALASLHGKVVLITGASSGIGEACAHAFHQVGCKVILTARRLNELERVKTEIIAQSTKGKTDAPKVLQLDVSDLESIPEKVKEALAFHGRIDVLINNAGMSYRGSVKDTKMEVHQKVMLVNYFGSVAVTTAILPHMISKKSGTIIAVSSIQGKLAVPFRTAYTASKFAMQAFFDSLRAEVAQYNIRVGVSSPSYVQTNISVNAVRGDNSQYGVTDTNIAKGMSAEYLAEEIVLQAATGEEDVIVGPFIHRLAPHLNVLFPGLMRMVMKLRAKKGIE